MNCSFGNCQFIYDWLKPRIQNIRQWAVEIVSVYKYVKLARSVS